jgi:hypothetical protein
MTDEREAVFALLPPIFRKCTTEDANKKYDLSLPFVIGEYVYATDGRIGVRKRVSHEVDSLLVRIERKGIFPRSIVEMFDEPFASEGTPIPDLSTAPVCTSCKGSGQVQGLYCDNCGDFNPHPAVNSECQECYGSGIEDGGSDGLILADHVEISYRFLKIIRDAGGVIHLPLNGANKYRTLFRCPDGVEGVVMPLEWNRERRRSDHVSGTKYQR